MCNMSKNCILKHEGLQHPKASVKISGKSQLYMLHICYVTLLHLQIKGSCCGLNVMYHIPQLFRCVTTSLVCYYILHIWMHIIMLQLQWYVAKILQRFNTNTKTTTSYKDILISIVGLSWGASMFAEFILLKNYCFRTLHISLWSFITRPSNPRWVTRYIKIVL